MPRVDSSMTSAQRYALMHADPVTGKVPAQQGVRTALVRYGYAKYVGSWRTQAYMTDRGRLARESLLESAKSPVVVNDLSFPKVEEITDYYMAGMSLQEIVQRAGVEVGDVLAALRFRKVLVGQ